MYISTLQCFLKTTYFILKTKPGEKALDVSYLLRLALQRSMRGDCGLGSLLPPGAEAGKVRGSPLLGEDPTLREWEHREDTDRWGE